MGSVHTFRMQRRACNQTNALQEKYKCTKIDSMKAATYLLVRWRDVDDVVEPPRSEQGAV